MNSADLLAQFREFVLTHEIVEHRVRRGIELFKAQAFLRGGTNLRISEVYVDGALKKYSYYWLDERNELIVGWDDAHHHPQVETFPHHRHREGQIEASLEHDLRAVLNYISERISGRT